MCSLPKPFLMKAAQRTFEEREAANASALQSETSPGKSPAKDDVQAQTLQKSPAKLDVPDSKKTCVVKIDKVVEKDMQKSNVAESPAEQCLQSAAKNSGSEEAKAVANVSESASTAGRSTSAANDDAQVEISDDSDADSIDIQDDDYWHPKSKRTKIRVVKKPWSNLEEEMVYKGVKKHGVGNWATIHMDFLPGRSNVDIKDKWRTMIRQGRLIKLSAKFGPLT